MANTDVGVAAGEFGGYTTVEEFAQKDPRGFEAHLQDNVKGYIK